jgi:hypothetical protein
MYQSKDLCVRAQSDVPSVAEDLGLCTVPEGSYRAATLDALERVRELLPDNFFESRAAFSDPRILKTLDMEWAIELEERLRFDLLNTVTTAEELSATLAALNEKRDALTQFYRSVEELPMFKVFGTAREHLWSDSLEQFTDELAKLSVEAGISVANGGGSEGAMGRTSRAWEKYRATDPESPSEVIIVPLDFSRFGWEDPLSGMRVIASDATPDLDLRTKLLHAIGGKPLGGSAKAPGRIHYPGGFGTLKEFGDDIVGEQLRDLAATIHSHKPDQGPIWVLNPEVVPGEGGYYDGLKQQIHMMAARGAIREGQGIAEDGKPGLIHFLDLKDPRADARRVWAAAVDQLAGA